MEAVSLFLKLIRPANIGGTEMNRPISEKGNNITGRLRLFGGATAVLTKASTNCLSSLPTNAIHPLDKLRRYYQYENNLHWRPYLGKLRSRVS